MTRTPKYGSDVIVDLLQSFGIEYASLNPGATYRGLHDSLVNYGAGKPEIILCTHEKVAVSLAHGYAKTTGRDGRDRRRVGLLPSLGIYRSTACGAQPARRPMTARGAGQDRLDPLVQGGRCATTGWDDQPFMSDFRLVRARLPDRHDGAGRPVCLC
jgi:hypothetical protein